MKDFHINHAMKTCIFKLSNEKLLYSINLINNYIQRENFKHDKKQFIERLDELKSTYKWRIKH